MISSITGNPNKLQAGRSVHGEVIWQSPSNIALIKYWGKKPVQLPRNPSISFTLDAAHTITSVSFKNRVSEENWINFFFEGSPNEHFALRIERYLSSIIEYFPFLEQLSLSIYSQNSFPHSSGIASSASAMSALALCICDMERIIFELPSLPNFYQKASFIARLGSGSACRSLFPVAALWGKTGTDDNGSSDLFAIPFEEVHDTFQNFRDDILIVSSSEKSVSSSAGHQLMESNWFAQQRYQQANANLEDLMPILKGGEVDDFGTIVENEALTLHALMMCSNPSYILMRPGTLSIIEAVRSFRRESGIPLFFTLDAGPNVHLLYPDDNKNAVSDFVSSKLLSYTESGLVIQDKVGSGPLKLPKYPWSHDT